MSTTLDDRLRALGDELLAGSAPITHYDLTHISVVPARPSPRRRRLAVAVLAAAAAAIIAVAVVNTRPDEPPSIGASSADGRMLLDPLPQGWELVDIARPRFDNQTRVHLYERVEEGVHAHVAVSVLDARWAMPDVPEQHRSVTVAGHAASLYDEDYAGSRAVSYEVNGSWVVVAATGLTDGELMALAGAVAIDDATSGSIASESLPVDFTDLGLALARESVFVAEAAGLNAGPQVSWRRGMESFGYYSVPGEASASLLAFFAESVRSVQVRGGDASLLTFANGPDFLGVVWVEAGRTYFASGLGVDRDELLDLIDRLGAATDDEWSEAEASLEPTAATIDPATGLPTPGSAIPTKITQFPVVAADALATLGSPQPHAQYLYYSAGIDHPGSAWVGAVGPANPTSSADNIVITVADPGNVETPPGDPGRIPTITEWTLGNGAELIIVSGGYTVVALGADIDLLYDMIELVEPLVVDGVLAGYDFNGTLPSGLVETAAPYRQGFDSGSFPDLDFNGGALSIRISPDPLANSLAFLLADFTVYETVLGKAYVVKRETSEAAAGFSVVANVGLSDGSTMTVTTSWLSVEEVIALIDSLQLVTQAEWEAMYDPWPAIVYGTGSAGTTATTVSEVAG